jgi:hypothetical protein
MSIGFAVLWFAVTYVVVTLIGIVHTVFNWKVLGMDTVQEPVRTVYDVVAYAQTVPYHPVYNILAWPMAAYLYFVQAQPPRLWPAAFALGAAWAVGAVLVDLIGWVLVRHPWRLSLTEMFVDYQPWITLVYVSILVSPFIAAAFYGSS